MSLQDPNDTIGYKIPMTQSDTRMAWRRVRLYDFHLDNNDKVSSFRKGRRSMTPNLNSNMEFKCQKT
jgi:hypothetical protein